MKFCFWIAGEINSLDCNWFITIPSYPKMKYHIWYHLCPLGHNTIVITAGLGLIMENETPANAFKHPLRAKELSGCYNCVYLLPCLYFIILDLRDAIKGANFGRFWKLLPMNAVFREAFLLHSCCKSCMPSFLLLNFMTYSQNPHQWKRQRKQIKWIAFYSKLETLSFRTPQASVASSILG